jgi:hypothetical protein
MPWRDMTTLLDTKTDLASTQLLLKKDIEAGLNHTIVRLGTVMVAVAGLLFTALKLTREWPRTPDANTVNPPAAATSPEAASGQNAGARWRDPPSGRIPDRR